MCERIGVVTDSDEHAQLAPPGVLGVDAELHGEAGRDAAGETGTTRSHFAGIVGGQDPEPEGAEGTKGTSSWSERNPRAPVRCWCRTVLYLRGTSSSAYLTATEYGPSTVGV